MGGRIVPAMNLGSLARGASGQAEEKVQQPPNMGRIPSLRLGDVA